MNKNEFKDRLKDPLGGAVKHSVREIRQLFGHLLTSASVREEREDEYRVILRAKSPMKLVDIQPRVVNIFESKLPPNSSATWGQTEPEAMLQDSTAMGYRYRISFYITYHWQK